MKPACATEFQNKLQNYTEKACLEKPNRKMHTSLTVYVRLLTGQPQPMNRLEDSEVPGIDYLHVNLCTQLLYFMSALH